MFPQCFPHFFHIFFPAQFSSQIPMFQGLPRRSDAPWDPIKSTSLPGVVHLPLQLGGAEGPEHPGGAPRCLDFAPRRLDLGLFGNGTMKMVNGGDSNGDFSG